MPVNRYFQQTTVLLLATFKDDGEYVDPPSVIFTVLSLDGAPKTYTYGVDEETLREVITVVSPSGVEEQVIRYSATHVTADASGLEHYGVEARFEHTRAIAQSFYIVQKPIIPNG